MKQNGKVRFRLEMLLLLVMASLAQVGQAAAGFTNAGVNLPGLDFGCVAWGDYDGDGRLDALLAGYNGSNRFTQLWRNTGSGFVNVNAAFTGVQNGTAVWGDYDNDGRLDLLLTGFGGGVPITEVWRNTGSGFTNINAGLTGIYFGSAAWGDYDNDGRLDIALSGYATQPTAGPVTEVWRNTPAGFVKVNAGITPLFNSLVDWGDYDNDGRSDLLIAGRDAVWAPVTEVWRNTGSGFSNIHAGLTGVFGGSAAWRDYDNDGRLDILVAGQSDTGDTVQVWRNTGSGFSSLGVPIQAGRWACVTWGDYDNDGWPDILVTGYRSTNAVTELWRNTGSGFVNSGIALPAIYYSAVSWGDYNNNGTLDLLLQGYTMTNLLTQIWGNTATVANTVPSVPATLGATVTGSGVRLSWTAATDGQTPSGGLTYNVRVGTFPGGGDIVSAQSSSSGFRLLPVAGNCGERLFAILTNLAAGVYYWGVQAVDSGMSGSAFAAEQSFVVGGAVLSVANPPGRVVVQVHANGAGTYTLQGSTNLVSWSTVTTLTTGSDGTASWTNYAPSGWRMYRLSYP